VHLIFPKTQNNQYFGAQLFSGISDIEWREFNICGSKFLIIFDEISSAKRDLWFCVLQV
jgi:hypothetical protein